MTYQQNQFSDPIGSSEQALTNPYAVPFEVRSLVNHNEDADEHEHPSAEVILNFSGTFGAVVWRDLAGETQTATVDADHCCVIPAGVRHCISGLRPCGLVSLIVGSVALSELVRERVTDVVVGNFRQITANDALARHLVTEFGHMLARHPHTVMVHAVGMTLAIKLLQSLWHRETLKESKVSGLSSVEQQRTHDYIAAHLADRISVSKLARHMSMSRTYFTRRFSAAFGVSPLQYALKMRVDKALELLRSGDYRVAEAAYAVGFFDQSHLDRHCRKFYGQPPSTMQRA